MELMQSVLRRPALAGLLLAVLAAGEAAGQRIRADGRDITAAVRDRLVSLKVTDSVDADADACELVLDDRGAAVELLAAQCSRSTRVVRRAEHVLTESDGYRTTARLERAAAPRDRTSSRAD